jgi:16S rRNA (uracil1498-N3)-methyltransferase
MRISRFYQASEILISNEFALSAENHRHAIQVLRLKVGDMLILFNGEGGEYNARVTTMEKRASSVIVESFNPVDRESPLITNLLLAMIKPDKMDFAIQKAVELGVSTIQPMLTKRSVINIKANRLEKKMQHWQGVLLAACEQSGRTRIPYLQEPLALEECLQRYQKSACIAMLPTTDSGFKELNGLNVDSGVSLLIGPEGGFTNDEEALMQQHQIMTVNFGCRILRAETAVIAGLTVCQQQWGDL